MGIFGAIMQVRRNPAAALQRQKIAEVSRNTYRLYNLTAQTTAMAAVANLIAQRSFAQFARLSLLAIGLREQAIFFHNVETVMLDQETEGWSEKLVSHSLTEGAWLIDFLFRKWIEKELRSNEYI